MPSSGPDERNADLAAFFGSLPAPSARELERLRDLVHRTAAGTQGVGPLAESLKWGEPSYTPQRKGIGSSVRLAGTADGRVALHFICHTGLVERFRELYPETFSYGGNRSILIAPGAALDEAALSHCIAMALTYHRDRRTERE